MKTIRISKNIFSRLSDKYLLYFLFALIALSLFFTESRNGFIPGGLHSGVSIHGLTLSKSLLDFEHPFFMYTSKELKGGKTVYVPYNRFPVFPFLLTSIIISPLGNNLFLQIYAARLFMILFFFLSIITVFLIINEIVKNKFKALSISFLTFSTYYLLFYNNIVFNDIPSLLGFVIALYIVIKHLDKKISLPKIFLFSFLTISMGWQSYAVFLAWFFIDTLELIFNRRYKLKEKFVLLFKQSSFRVLITAIICGILILSIQLMNEWKVIGGFFWDLPSVGSGLWRSGLISSSGHTQFQWTFYWLTYLPSQAYTIMISLIPFWPIFDINPNLNVSIVIVVSITIYNLLKYFNNRKEVNKYHLILILSGFFWTIPMRHFVALHDFQSIFYIGFIISTFLNLFSLIKIKFWNLLAINITLLFIINLSISNYLKPPFVEMNKTVKEFKGINDILPTNSKIYFDGDRQRAIPSSRYAIDLILFGNLFTSLDSADFIITKNSNFQGLQLTKNPSYNLFKVIRGQNK